MNTRKAGWGLLSATGFTTSAIAALLAFSSPPAATPARPHDQVAPVDRKPARHATPATPRVVIVPVTEPVPPGSHTTPPRHSRTPAPHETPSPTVTPATVRPTPTGRCVVIVCVKSLPTLPPVARRR